MSVIPGEDPEERKVEREETQIIGTEPEPEERPEDQSLWWPNMDESRMIMEDVVATMEAPYPPNTPLPEDPDPGQED